MPLEKATALVIRVSDWSETSRICTLWSRELGKVRALAKGGRRLRSSFENGLDLLSLCSIVLLRKTSGSLDLLTEARVQERFGQLRSDLAALHAAYYVAELLGDLTEEYDPHPALFDEALAALRTLGQPGIPTGPRLARFEMVLLRELGYGLHLDACAVCGQGEAVAFSAAAGGVICPLCLAGQRDKRPVSAATLAALRSCSGDDWHTVEEAGLRQEVRQILNQYVTYVLGRRPRLLPYLGS